MEVTLLGTSPNLEMATLLVRRFYYSDSLTLEKIGSDDFWTVKKSSGQVIPGCRVIKAKNGRFRFEQVAQ